MSSAFRGSLACVLHSRTLFCGCRSVCKEFLNFCVCDRVRTFVRPVPAADLAPLAGMVMRGPGPNLRQRARGSEKVSGLPNPDHVDHLPIQLMPSSQLCGPFWPSCLIRRWPSPDRDSPRRALTSPRCNAPFYWPMQRPRPSAACVPADAPATDCAAPLCARPSGSPTWHP